MSSERIRNICVKLSLAMFLLAASGASADDVIPADAPMRWWKGNLHTHTFWSDGDDFPEMVAEWYRTRGYNFLALTDHNILAQGMNWKKESAIVGKGGDTVVPKYFARFGKAWVETRGEGAEREFRLKPLDEFRALVEERGRFLLIPAEEISTGAEGVPVHINASNIHEKVDPLKAETVVETVNVNLRAVHEQAEKAGREILAHLNHPNFGWAITAHDLAHVVMERHFEVYNGHPGVGHLGDDTRPGVERLWDIANTIRLVDLNAEPLFGIATDDSHAYHGQPGKSHPGRGWIMVRSTHLTPDYIVKAVKAGDHYASSGVVLADVRYDADKRSLEIDIAPDGDATFTTEFIGTLQGVTTAGEDLPKVAPPKKGRTSKKYSDQIGAVLKKVDGLKARYELTGKELYVRAVVTSSRDADDPSFAGQKRQAWTQPVGWKLRAAPSAAK
jgi:hypothetical protein